MITNGILIDSVCFKSKNNIMQKIKSIYRKMIAISLLLIMQVIAFGQDSTSSTATTTTTTSTTTIQPWMWVVGAVIILVIIIGLARSGSKDKVIITKETIKE
jgi:hypothetical protein